MATNLAELAAQQGPGWQAAGGPTPRLDTQGIPVPGVYTVVLTGPNGAQRVATLYAPEPAGPTTFPNLMETDPQRATFDVQSVEESIKADQTSPQEQLSRVQIAEQNAARAASEAEVAAAALKKVQEDTREREYNQAHGNGYLSHEELRKVNQDAVDQKLTADQLALRKQEIENNNKNTARSNEISEINANAAKQNAATQARRELAQTKYEDHQMELEDLKFEWTKSESEIAQRNLETKAKLDALTQQQANELGQETLRQRRIEATQTAENNVALLEQRRQEAAQTAQTAAQTAATSAAANVYGTERQAQTAAGTVGGNLLSNRATAANNLIQNILSGAAGLSQGSAGRYGMLGGGLHAMPAGFSGDALVGGAMGVSGQMFGGQETLDAAARMVRGAAPGAELTPQGQAAIGVLQQAFDRFGQLAGAPHPAVAASGAARQNATTGGLNSPVTLGATTPVATGFAAPQTRQRADQMNGAAPAGNAMAPAGVAGAVAPDSPMYLGSKPQTGAPVTVNLNL